MAPSWTWGTVGRSETRGRGEGWGGRRDGGRPEGSLHLGVGTLHGRHPLAVRPLELHPEGVALGRDLLDRHPAFHLLPAHRTLVVVGPGVALDRALGHAAHSHARVVHTVVGVDLLLAAVAEDADAPRRPVRRGALGAADHAELPLEPLAVVRGRDLPAGPHRAGF